MDTLHYTRDRASRRAVINNVVGYGRDIFSAVIDRGHVNGAEIHTVTDSGIIKVYNARTHRHITDLIARPNQIKRVYNAAGANAPRWLLDIARDNQMRGLNYA